MVAWAGRINIEKTITWMTLEWRTESVPSAISCRFRAKYTTKPGHINGSMKGMWDGTTVFAHNHRLAHIEVLAEAFKI